MSFSFKSVYRLVSRATQIGVKQVTLCLKGAHPGTGEFGAGASLALQTCVRSHILNHAPPGKGASHRPA
jgi:hypothetical protein